MPAPYFNGLLNGDDLSSSVYSLLAISFSVAIGVNGLKLHERRIKLRAVILRALSQTLLTYAIFIVLLVLVLKASPRMMILCQLGIALPLISLLRKQSSETAQTSRSQYS